MSSNENAQVVPYIQYFVCASISIPNPNIVRWLLGKKVIWKRCWVITSFLELFSKTTIGERQELWTVVGKKRVLIAWMSWAVGLYSIIIIIVNTIVTTTIITFTTIMTPSSSSTSQVAMSCDSDDLAVRWGWTIDWWCFANWPHHDIDHHHGNSDKFSTKLRGPLT